MKKITVLLLLCLTSFSLYGLDDTDKSKFLKWKKIDGASFYKVEIVKGEREILQRETEENYIYLDLPPGEYQFNITVLNKFRKKVAQTGWKKLTIEAAKQPLIKNFKPLQVYLEENKALLYIDAYNIKGKSLFFLISESGKKIKGKTLEVDNSVFKVLFESDIPLSPGEYLLKVENPSGLKDEARNPLVLKKQVIPSVTKISEKIFLNKGIYSSIILKGKNFEKNIQIEFQSDSEAFKPVSMFLIRKLF